MFWDLIIIMLLALFGIGLIILEVFFIPGFGVAGIGGIAFMGGAVWFAYEQLGTTVGNITLLGCLIALIIGVYWFVKSKALNRMALKKEIDSTAPNTIGSEIREGETGVTLSILNPMGTILVKGHQVEAKSENGFIEVGKNVKIIRIFPTSVVVEETE
ncbi:MAG: NfeD family protein [Bacteroidales bacterium]